MSCSYCLKDTSGGYLNLVYRTNPTLIVYHPDIRNTPYQQHVCNDCMKAYRENNKEFWENIDKRFLESKNEKV